jgi:hypothetical protein
VKIDREIVTFAAQPQTEGDIRQRAAHARRPRRDDHAIEMRVIGDNRRRRRLNDVGEVRVRKATPQSANGRRRENHIANFAQANQKNPREFVTGCVGEWANTRLRELVILDGGLVDEHHGNVVFDGIHAFARPAFQRRAILDEGDGCFATRTRENLEQLRIDRHVRNI